MSKSFSSGYGGAENAGRVPVLSGGMDFESFTMPNKDAQWIESQGYQGEDICRIYGVPPHKAGIMAHSTNNNIEHQAIEAVQDCLLPWCRRLETEADIKLFGSVSRGKLRTRLDLQTLLRGDSATQTTNLASQVTNGLRTVNEGREELDLNPIEGGDTPLIQGAMAPLERVMNPPAPPAAPGVPGATPTQPAEEPEELLEMPMMMQSGSYDCGACAAHMVAEFFGVGNGRTEADYITELGTTTADGTEPEAIVDLLNDAGLVTTSGNGMTLDNLRDCFMDGKPVIASIQSTDAPVGGSSGGHYVVVCGVGLGQVFFNDPATGECEMLTEEEFDARWHDIEADGVTSDHFGIAVSDSFDEEDEPEPVETATAAAPAAPDEYAMPDNLRQPFATLLTDAYNRRLRIESDKARHEKSKGRLKDWAKDYYTDSLPHTVAAVRPVVEAFVAAAGKKADGAAISNRLATEHIAYSLSGIQSDGIDAVIGTNGRAAAQAARHLDLIWEAIR